MSDIMRYSSANPLRNNMATATYPNNFVKVTFGGSVYVNEDIWTNGINFGNTGGSDLTLDTFDGQAAVEDVYGHVRMWFEDGRSGIGPGATLDWVKIAIIQANGSYPDNVGPWIYDSTETITGGANYNTWYPLPQQTLAVSFMTDVRRGAGRTGRIYPPLSGYNVGARVPNTITQPIAESAADLLTTVSAALADNGLPAVRPIVASQKTDRHHEILNVRVGDVVDTQRSRRNAMNENYTGQRDLATA